MENGVVHKVNPGSTVSEGFPGQYALEVDTDMDGRGDFLVIAEHPSGNDWTTAGVQIYVDANGDVGGENIINGDSEGRGNGFEILAFEQGSGDDPDAAWARVSPGHPNSVEVAFKASFLEGDSTYMVGLWSANGTLDAALFDLNDHFTHEQAGEANEEFANFYPIKELAEMDNTCRAGMGFVPSGNEPAICAGQ